MDLTLSSAIFLFFAGLVGGTSNGIAGGGTFFVFPALLFTGMPPVPANATNSVALWPGLAASARAFWPRLKVERRLMVALMIGGLLGGLGGAVLLIRTPARIFVLIMPWLMLTATVVFALGSRVARRSVEGAAPLVLSPAKIVLTVVVEFVLAIYGGYFGGGIGILLLALFSMVGMSDIHEMNALKIVLVTIINGVAMVTFIVARALYWPQTLVIVVGAVVGGHFGALLSQRLPAAWVRGFVLLVGTSVTIYFFLRHA
jgi:uncharacterized protein